MHRKTAAIIDANAILANYDFACRLVSKSKNIAVVKSNAYGHGLVPVAKILEAVVPALAVAILDEAIELRVAGIQKPILVLEGVNSSDGIKEAVEQRLTLMTHSDEQVALLCESGGGASPEIWLKVDTGMHRLGIAPDNVRSIVLRLREQGITPGAVCTHLSRGDETGSDETLRQMEIFHDCTAGLELPLSIANSSAILGWPGSHSDWNRPGYMLYGNNPLDVENEHTRKLIPAMSLRAPVIAIRDIGAGESVGYGGNWRAAMPSRIGTLAIGYGDGYPRLVPNGTATFINGHPAPVVGRVSMDLTTVDLTEHPGASVGDMAELWGNQVAVNEIAAACGSIGYELLTGVSQRVPREYDGWS